MPPEISADPFLSLRQKMVESQIAARGVSNAGLLKAIAEVPRHEFVPAEYRIQAYEDHPLPIGQEQTISQPFIVALMIAALQISKTDNVLEVGTGSGYQTAILARLANHVYSVERHAVLADSARSLLDRLGYCNVTVIIGDGTRGLPDHAPYDAMIVSAAAQQIPLALMDQLKEDGRMVIPIGPPGVQQLQLIRKTNGRTHVQTLENCRFVPLVPER
jgi:protein-L-isoaspartate(D-aspartate) O-methyltransferase